MMCPCTYVMTHLFFQCLFIVQAFLKTNLKEKNSTAPISILHPIMEAGALLNKVLGTKAFSVMEAAVQVMWFLVCDLLHLATTPTILIEIYMFITILCTEISQ